MSSDAGHEDLLRPRVLANALRHRWYVVVACGLVLAALGFLVATGTTTHYASSATIVVQPTVGNPLSPDATVNGQQVTVAMETESGLVVSQPVVEAVGRALGVPAASVRSHVAAKVPPNTKFITITYRATTARDARAGAQAFAVAYLDFRKAQTTATVDRQLTELSSQATSAQKELNSLAHKNGSAAQASRQVLMSRVANIQASISSVRATDAYPGSISSDATLPGKPARISPAVIVGAALLLGLGIGVAVAAARESLRQVLRPGDVLAHDGVPVLAELSRAHSRTTLLWSEDDDGVEEAFRRLRVGIGATSPRARTICLAPAAPSCSAAAPAANLATVMSRAGLEVELVDATSGHEVSGLFDAASQPMGENGWERAGLSAPVWVISQAGREGMSGHIDTEALEDLVTRKRASSHYLLLATDALTSADAETVALAADSVVLLVEQNRTRTSQLDRQVRRAKTLGIQIRGAFSLPRSRRDAVTSRQQAAGPARSPWAARRLRIAWRTGGGDDGR